jgi:hypothetical protein
VSIGFCGSHIVGYSGGLPQKAFVKAALFDVAPVLAVDVWMENAYGRWSSVMNEVWQG